MNQKKYAVGIDLGGTKIQMGLIDTAGKVLKEFRVKCDVQGGFSAIKGQICNFVHSLLDEYPNLIAGIGIGIPGQVDANSGFVYSAPNLGWNDIPLYDEFYSELSLPLLIMNDLRAITYGEWKYGAGRRVNDLICLYVGTGIGAGIVSGGHLLKGANNSAGEVGHMSIQINGPQCRCGNKGCFEAIAGGWGIAERAKEAIKSYGIAGNYLMRLANGIDQIKASHVIAGALIGDALCELILAQTVEALISGTVSLVNILNPQLLILGGGVIQGAPFLLKEIENGIQSRALKSASSILKVKHAALGSHSGLIGAAALLFKKLSIAMK